MRARLVQPWVPNLSVAPRRPMLAQTATPLVPPASIAPAAPSGAGTAIGLGAAAVTLGVASLGVLFSYGVARESKSKMVKTTGYILAGIGGLVAIVDAIAVGTAVAKSV